MKVQAGTWYSLIRRLFGFHRRFLVLEKTKILARILTTYCPASSVVTVAATLPPPSWAAYSIVKNCGKEKGTVQTNVWRILCFVGRASRYSPIQPGQQTVI